MKRVTVRDVCERIDYGLAASATKRGSAKFLRITDIEKSYVEWRSVPLCVASQSEIEKYRIESGDVVIARTGASTGRSLWVTVEEPSVFASYLVRLRAGSQIDSRYLGYVLSSDRWRQYVASVAHGKSAQPNMSAAAMAEFSFDLPGLADQRAIAEVLGALDDKIAVNDRLVECADSLAGAIARRALSGDSVRLGDVASITMGSSPPGASYNEAGNGVPFYQGVRDFGARVPTRRVWTTSPVRLAEPGDTLLSVRAPVGRTNLAAEALCLGRGLAALRSTLGHPITLFHQVRSARSAWDPYEAEGTVFGAINRSQLESVRVPAVDSEKAPQVEERLVGIEELIGVVLAESTCLAETRDELLPLLMSGRRRVKDAERAVEEVL